MPIPSWGAVDELLSSRIRDFALGVAGLHPGLPAAVVGAGTDFLTEGLVAAGARVIAVDPSRDGVAELRRRFGGESAVAIRHMRDGRLPLADRQVDAVFATMFLHHTETPCRAIAEMRRVLKPGGRLVITDLDKHDLRILQEDHHDRWMGFYRSDIRGWLSRAGFSNIIVSGIPGEPCRGAAAGRMTRAGLELVMATGTAAGGRHVGHLLRV